MSRRKKTKETPTMDQAVAPESAICNVEPQETAQQDSSSSPEVDLFEKRYCRAATCPGYATKASEVAHPSSTCGSIFNTMDFVGERSNADDSQVVDLPAIPEVAGADSPEIADSLDLEALVGAATDIDPDVEIDAPVRTEPGNAISEAPPPANTVDDPTIEPGQVWKLRKSPAVDDGWTCLFKVDLLQESDQQYIRGSRTEINKICRTNGVERGVTIARTLILQDFELVPPEEFAYYNLIFLADDEKRSNESAATTASEPTIEPGQIWILLGLNNVSCMHFRVRDVEKGRLTNLVGDLLTTNGTEKRGFWLYDHRVSVLELREHWRLVEPGTAEFLSSTVAFQVIDKEKERNASPPRDMPELREPTDVIDDLAEELGVDRVYVDRTVNVVLRTIVQFIVARGEIQTSPAISAIRDTIRSILAERSQLFPVFRLVFEDAFRAFVGDSIQREVRETAVELDQNMRKMIRGIAESLETQKENEDAARNVDFGEDLTLLVRSALGEGGDFDALSKRLSHLESRVDNQGNDLANFNRSQKLRKQNPTTSKERGTKYREQQRKAIAEVRRQKAEADAIERGKAPPKPKGRKSNVQKAAEASKAKVAKASKKRAAVAKDVAKRGPGRPAASPAEKIEKFMGSAKNQEVRKLLLRVPTANLDKVLKQARNGVPNEAATKWDKADTGTFAKWFYGGRN